jgi:hypothetical protein
MKKKKFRLPRATWHIKSTSKVKEDDTKYARHKEKRRTLREESE